MIVMVTGGRTYTDKEEVRRNLLPFGLGDILIVGGADGADELARRYWHYKLELPYVVMPAPWSRVGRPAGMMRNQAMLVGNAIAPYAELVPELVIAFPGGRGTQAAMGMAEAKGIPIARSLDF